MGGNLRMNRLFSSRIFIACAAALLAGSISGFAVLKLHGHFDVRCLQRFPLLSPFVPCESQEPLVFMPEYEEFQANLSDWIDTQKQAGLITEGAVYFRDLVGGPWFGIRETAEFVPASLFKVPVMIAILRASQDVPGLLEQQVVMSGSYTGLMNVEHPSESLESGVPYTVNQLLEKMIVYSDNASSDLLKDVLRSIDETGKSVETIYRQLGMYSAATEHRLSVKNYSSLFRVLFNGRYLSYEMSEKALELLSRSAFTDALVAGIPKGTKVAHKFGIRDVPGEDIKQFHDCGIVYYPKRPYLLCIMTRASDTESAIMFIREVSRRVYKQVDDRMSANEESLYDMR